MTLKRLGAFALLVLSLFLVACSGAEEPEPEPTLEPTPTPVVVETPEPTPEPVIDTRYRNPLTGELTETDISQYRPFAVTINNLQPALPQHGLSQAEIIYEFPVEGGITRLLALFQDIEGIGEIGPVRSARLYFLDAIQAHDAIYVHAGGSPDGIEGIWSRGVSSIDGVGGSGREFFRCPERRQRVAMEHTMMTTDELLLENVERYPFRREHETGFTSGFAFVEDGTPEGGTSAQEVSVRFSDQKTGEFEFDTTTGRYLVSQYGAPHMDGAVEEQLSVTNVLVLFASFRVMDTDARLMVDLNLGGEGYFFSGGQGIPIRWSKGGYDAPFVFTLEDGLPLELGIGQSYINIVNSNMGSVTFR
ncbi:MAG: DUF3048 domain-containing protein [Oscillospiraceae bacterium]|nr:DUF3048 domain-containing protein [Oscillospiraceae bacterium]